MIDIGDFLTSRKGRKGMAEDFVALGADRLGTSRIVKAVKAMEK